MFLHEFGALHKHPATPTTAIIYTAFVEGTQNGNKRFNHTGSRTEFASARLLSFASHSYRSKPSLALLFSAIIPTPPHARVSSPAQRPSQRPPSTRPSRRPAPSSDGRRPFRRPAPSSSGSARSRSARASPARRIPTQ